MIKGFIATKPYPHNKDRIYINGKRLSWRKSLKYVKESVTGFSWGYAGAGPGQLAFAILLELTNEEIARKLYYTFKFEFISQLPLNKNFEVSEEEVFKAINKCAVVYKKERIKYGHTDF